MCMWMHKRNRQIVPDICPVYRRASGVHCKCEWVSTAFPSVKAPWVGAPILPKDRIPSDNLYTPSVLQYGSPPHKCRDLTGGVCDWNLPSIIEYCLRVPWGAAWIV